MNASVSYHQFLVSRELGGAGLIALHLAKEMTQRGHQSHIWLPGAGAASQAAEVHGLPWRRFGLAAMAKNNLCHALSCVAVASRIRRRPGIAHIHTPAVYRMLRPALRRLRLRTVVHVHLEPTEAELRWAFKDPPDLIIPCAHFLGGLTRSLMGPDGDRLSITAVPNAVDVQRFQPGDRPAAKQNIGMRADRTLLLMLANLAPHKGQETAIRTVAELTRRGRPVECWIAGVERGAGHNYQQKLEDLAKDLNVADRIRFMGFRSDSPNLLRAADFLLLPSTHEGLPLSILEAQATKVPVLAAPTAGIPEVIENGKTGFLIDAHNPAAYAQRIEQLLDLPDLCGRVAECAFRRVHAEHTWEVYSRRIWALYEQALAPRSETRDGSSMNGPRVEKCGTSRFLNLYSRALT